MRNSLVLAALTITAATSASAQLTTASIDLNNQIPALRIALAPSDPQERPRAVTHSDLYYTRLKIHRIGSYLMLPLVAAQYYVGDRLLNDDVPPSWAKGTHGVLAGGVAVLFGVNTVTGVWNLWESRHDSGGRARKYVHAALLIAADAGFVWTAMTAEGGDDGGSGSNSNIHHRNVAIGSIGVATLGTVMMWLWK